MNLEEFDAIDEGAWAEYDGLEFNQEADENQLEPDRVSHGLQRPEDHQRRQSNNPTPAGVDFTVTGSDAGTFENDSANGGGRRHGALADDDGMAGVEGRDVWFNDAVGGSARRASIGRSGFSSRNGGGPLDSGYMASASAMTSTQSRNARFVVRSASAAGGRSESAVNVSRPHHSTELRLQRVQARAAQQQHEDAVQLSLMQRPALRVDRDFVPQCATRATASIPVRGTKRPEPTEEELAAKKAAEAGPPPPSPIRKLPPVPTDARGMPFGHRLHALAMRRVEELEETAGALEPEDAAECTFRPQVSAYAAKLPTRTPDEIAEALASCETQRSAREALVAEVERQRRAECPFTPAVDPRSAAIAAALAERAVLASNASGRTPPRRAADTITSAASRSSSYHHRTSAAGTPSHPQPVNIAVPVGERLHRDARDKAVRMRIREHHLAGWEREGAVGASVVPEKEAMQTVNRLYAWHRQKQDLVEHVRSEYHQSAGTGSGAGLGSGLGLRGPAMGGTIAPHHVDPVEVTARLTTPRPTLSRSASARGGGTGAALDGGGGAHDESRNSTSSSSGSQVAVMVTDSEPAPSTPAKRIEGNPFGTSGSIYSVNAGSSFKPTVSSNSTKLATAKRLQDASALYTALGCPTSVTSALERADRIEAASRAAGVEIKLRAVRAAMEGVAKTTPLDEPLFCALASRAQSRMGCAPAQDLAVLEAFAQQAGSSQASRGSPSKRHSRSDEATDQQQQQLRFAALYYDAARRQQQQQERTAARAVEEEYTKLQEAEERSHPLRAARENLQRERDRRRTESAKAMFSEPAALSRTSTATRSIPEVRRIPTTGENGPSKHAGGRSGSTLDSAMRTVEAALSSRQQQRQGPPPSGDDEPRGLPSGASSAVVTAPHVMSARGVVSFVAPPTAATTGSTNTTNAGDPVARPPLFQRGELLGSTNNESALQHHEHRGQNAGFDAATTRTVSADAAPRHNVATGKSAGAVVVSSSTDTGGASTSRSVQRQNYAHSREEGNAAPTPVKPLTLLEALYPAQPPVTAEGRRRAQQQSGGSMATGGKSLKDLGRRLIALQLAAAAEAAK